MQAYGRKKHHTRVVGHQECGDCHPVQKNKKTRGRREGDAEIRSQVATKEETPEKLVCCFHKTWWTAEWIRIAYADAGHDPEKEDSYRDAMRTVGVWRRACTRRGLDTAMLAEAFAKMGDPPDSAPDDYSHYTELAKTCAPGAHVLVARLADRCAKWDGSEGQFAAVVAAAVEQLGRRVLAEEFEVAESTVSRWASGAARPHPTIQREIVSAVGRRAI